MATLIRMKRSPYWWVSWINPNVGRRERFSTKLRDDDPVGTKKAKRILAEYQNKKVGGMINRGLDRCEAWVPAWLRSRFGHKENSLKTATYQWEAIEEYLNARGVTRPAELTRAHCYEFIDYRKEQTPETSINTLLVYLGRLRNIMNEAVKREYCTTNPAAALGIRAQ